ncbi:ribosomal protein-like protein [Parasponia andersonii]|uniref:Ribosomal protein-like protein n=1 Tax=Parasponia andersonii TaxID=3476 RepID=A0A2P5B4L8_PARAD|nr:ribosomal protein-like protein [Parasponia andersonii]
MEKPGLPQNQQKRKQQQQLPSPQELISHYESQGLDSQQASLKVIEDLQAALFRVITSGRGKKDKLLADAARKVDSANSRLALLDAKLDSKPGYSETFALGIASGLTLKGLGSVFPHVVGAVSQIWNSARSVSKDSPP